jgi:PucR C-terminal helix-turn-helix domain
VPKAGEHSPNAPVRGDVGTVGVALFVGMGVVLAMVGHPGDRRSLDRHRPEDREQVLEWLRGLKRAVGEQAVEADRYPDRGQQVHESGDDQVGRSDPAVPEQANCQQGREEGDYHGTEVDSFLSTAHLAHAKSFAHNQRDICAISKKESYKVGMRMTKTVQSAPWHGISPSVADLIEPELSAVTEEILATIAREVPEYERPLEGKFGHGIRTGVNQALLQFVALVRDPDGGRERGREVYVELGRGEQRVGRTLDSLQAAYRIGARVAWRRIAEAGRRAELDIGQLTLLAEAIFAYIDELSADSVDGYAEAQAAVEDLRGQRRQELVTLLLRDPPASAADRAAAAHTAGWEVPRQLAVAACSDDELGAIAGRLPADALVTVFEGAGCALVPDPHGPGRRDQLKRAAAGSVLALGPAVDAPAAARSWELASSLLRTAAAGRVPARGLLLAEDHLAYLLLAGSPTVIELIASRRLAPLDDLTERARKRMRETALAYVRHHGNAVAMAAELHVHPQTARYRIAKLRDLYGNDLGDPDTRFELEIALRAGA